MSGAEARGFLGVLFRDFKAAAPSRGDLSRKVRAFPPFPQKKAERMGHGVLCELAQSEGGIRGLKPAVFWGSYSEASRPLLPPVVTCRGRFVLSHPFRRRKRKGWGTECCANWRRAREEFGG